MHCGCRGRVLACVVVSEPSADEIRCCGLLFRFADHAGLEKCEYRPDNKALYGKHLVRQTRGLGGSGRTASARSFSLSVLSQKAPPNNTTRLCACYPVLLSGRQLVGQGIQGMADLDRAPHGLQARRTAPRQAGQGKAGDKQHGSLQHTSTYPRRVGALGALEHARLAGQGRSSHFKPGKNEKFKETVKRSLLSECSITTTYPSC